MSRKTKFIKGLGEVPLDPVVETPLELVGPDPTHPNLPHLDLPGDEPEVVTLRNLATAVQTAAKEMQGKYYELCIFIRDKQIAPDLLTNELSALGFHKTRIAEIKRVCFSTPAIFEDYKQRTIGFRLALQKARSEGDEPEVAPQASGKAVFTDALRALVEKELETHSVGKWTPITFEAGNGLFTLTYKTNRKSKTKK